MVVTPPFTTSTTTCIGALLGLLAVTGQAGLGQEATMAVPIRNVSVDGAFWGSKLATYRQSTIPHSWQYVTREIEDNEIAAGLRQGERGQDTPWNQANLHKVLETCAYALAAAPNPALDARVDEIIAAIAGAQQPNGYVNALITVRGMTPWANLDGQHDGYVAGHLIEAAVAHYEATGKRAFLNVACRLADHIYEYFITEGHEGLCGHAELELALVRLHRVTDEPRYLELAKDWIERRGKPWAYTSDTPRSYFMDHLPIRDVPEVTGHAVRTMFYLTGVTGVANELDDVGLKDAARGLWHDTVDRKMYITGSVGAQAADEGFGAPYDLPNDGYCESCAACGLLYFAHEMFLMDGEGQAVDTMERVLYNALLHGISLDGTTTYYRSPLSDQDHIRDNCWVCCPPCISRTLLRLPEYVYATSGDRIYVDLYTGGEARVDMPGGAVEITQQTDYPWDGHVRLTLQAEGPVEFDIRLRIPAWARSFECKINGATAEIDAVDRGFASLRRAWQPGDVIELDLPMPVERIQADPRVTADVGRVALQRGPIVYGFEGVDNAGDIDITLATDPAFQVESRPDPLGGVTTITAATVEGRRVVAVPFYALANRESSRQIIWVRQQGLTEDAQGWDGALYRPWAP